MASDPKESWRDRLIQHKELVQTYASILFFLAAVVLLALAAFTLGAGRAAATSSGPSFNFEPFIPFLVLVVAAIVALLAGLSSLDASNPSAPDIIPPHDRKTFFEKARDPIAAAYAYFRLRSMRGVTGFFQKMDIQGLPLATIALTIFFAAAAGLMTESELRSSFLDLTKLTLGAFIGSFVQRMQNAQAPVGRERAAPIEQDIGGDGPRE